MKSLNGNKGKLQLLTVSILKTNRCEMVFFFNIQLLTITIIIFVKMMKKKKMISVPKCLRVRSNIAHHKL